MTQATNLHVLKEQFASGELAKPDFINHALEIHRQLFSYVDITKSTDVHEIVVNPAGVSFVMGDERIRLYAPPNEARVAPVEVMNFGRYEPEETEVMDLLSHDARQILDIGANIGWYSVRFAKRNPGARVHAFEPMPISYSYLQRNISANDAGAEITPYNYGLSDAGGSFKFFIAPTGGTNASLLNVALAADAHEVVGLTLTLDQWCSNQGVKPDFIKCDVEGAELLVFRGGRETLMRDRPIVFAELLRKWAKPFGYHPNEVLSFFAELGYICFAVGKDGVRQIVEVDDQTIETNYAFVHTEAHLAAIVKLKAVE